MGECEKAVEQSMSTIGCGASEVSGIQPAFPEERETPKPEPVILLVDDEPAILSSLRRLLRATKYKVLTAEGGEAALEILASNAVDLIISDMRMPYMNGAEFLSRARALYPDSMRILLTGYSEIDSAVRAINEGGVYRYLTKPWDDNDLLLTVNQAIEQQNLRRETVRLTELTVIQNEQLRAFNTGLEAQVRSRTEEIRQTVLFLEDAQRELKRNFTAMVQVCANMIELRCGALGGESSRVGEVARSLAVALDLSGLHVQEVFCAGLLHGIGKLSLPDELLEKSLDRMTTDETRLFYQHPLRAQMVLTPVHELNHVAQIIRHQYERFNGRGTPDGLIGDQIPLGSRILAVARDFEALLSGSIVKRPVTRQQALQAIVSQSGVRYDPLVIDRFVALSKDPAALGQGEVAQINGQQLKEGMRLADDLHNSRGVLLMTKGSVVTAHQVAQIRRFEALEPTPFAVLVHAGAPS